MREHINLVESMMLNEFIATIGSTAKSMLDLQVFQDINGMDNETVTGSLSDKFRNKYRKLGKAREKQIMPLQDMPLTPTMVDYLNSVYQTDEQEYYEPGSETKLGPIYDKQLAMCDRILADIDKIVKDPELMRHEMISSILKALKYGSTSTASNIKRLIDRLKKYGADYPEFAAIEKSLNASSKI